MDELPKIPRLVGIGDSAPRYTCTYGDVRFQTGSRNKASEVLSVVNGPTL